MVSFARAESYYVQDLGTLGGRQSASYGINNLGQVVGYADITGSMYEHAVLFSGTGSNNIDLDASGPVGYVGNSLAINDSGVIVGNAYTATGRYQPTLFTLTNKIQIGGLCSDSATAGSAQAINNSGGVAGWAADCDFTAYPTLFDIADTNNDIAVGALGSDGVAYAINSAGWIVGYGTLNDGSVNRHAFLNVKTNSIDLGTLNDIASIAYDINDANEIIGTSSVSNQTAFHATLFSGTGSNNIDLGTLGGQTSHALALNNLGEIVGVSYPSNNDNSLFHGFIYKNGVMHDLNNVVLPNCGFRDISLLYEGGGQASHVINDSGQIAGVGYGTNTGLLHAILLTPVLRRLGATIHGKDVVVTFDAIAGKTYRLQQTTDLSNPNWQNVPGVSDFTATVTGPAQFTYVSGLALPTAYYRVQLLP